MILSLCVLNSLPAPGVEADTRIPPLFSRIMRVFVLLGIVTKPLNTLGLLISGLQLIMALLGSVAMVAPRRSIPARGMATILVFNLDSSEVSRLTFLRPAWLL